MVALGNTFECVWIRDFCGCDDVKMKKERMIIWIMCLLFLLMGFFLFLGFKEAQECVGNPFIYGANKITNEDSGNLYCSCSFGSPRYSPFYFDNEYLEVIRE